MSLRNRYPSFLRFLPPILWAFYVPHGDPPRFVLRLLMFAMWACVTFPLTVLGGIIGAALSRVLRPGWGPNRVS